MIVHQEMLYLVKCIAKLSGNTYGEKRIKAALNALNALSFLVSGWKVAKLMKEANVWCAIRKNIKQQRIVNTASHFITMSLNKISL